MRSRLRTAPCGHGSGACHTPGMQDFADRRTQGLREEIMLQIKNLTKLYDGIHGVKDISLHIEPGSIFGFIGHNGAGKSTTIRAIVGVLDFSQGEILIEGHSVRDESLLCKQITAYIPDNPDLYENLTGMQYLYFIADVFGIGQQERDSRIDYYADRFELADDLGSPIASYSHGMKQKVAVIGALIHDPKLLVLDEPFVGLDPKAVFTLKEIMREICDKGAAVFFSTHVLDVAEKLCDEVAIISDGKIVRSGSMAELTSDKSLEEIFLEAVG